MKDTRYTSKRQSIDLKLKDYRNLSKTLLLSSVSKSRSLLPLGAAFLAGVPAGDAAIISSGPQNIPISAASCNAQPVFPVNINLAGGADLNVRVINTGPCANDFLQVVDAGGDFDVTAWSAGAAPPYCFPYARAASFAIGNGPFRVNATGTLDAVYSMGPLWDNYGFPLTRSVGFRFKIGANTHYGFVKITWNGFTEPSGTASGTILDWAYESTPLTPIVFPIELTSFEYRLNANDLQLTWHTASETDNAGFEIERSENGLKFNTVGWVDGKGTTLEPQTYYYDDKNLREGKTYYYRLRQVDYDGQFEFSPMVTVTVGGKGSFVSEFYPSPADGAAKLDFIATESANWSMVLLDISGKELLQRECPISKGENALEFDFSGFANGIYFVKFVNGTEQFYRKLVLN